MVCDPDAKAIRSRSDGGAGPSEPPMPAGEIAARIVRQRDYSAPDFLIDAVDLAFDLGEASTRVSSRLALRRNKAAMNNSSSLRLDGEASALLSLALDGMPLTEGRYTTTAGGLVVNDVPPAFTIEALTELAPHDNTDRYGLYMRDGVFCTHCEPEGFRLITPFLDRPDVL